MGLMDILNGMQNGPRGQTKPGSGGMSPMTMALLGLLAYKAFKGMHGGQPAPSGAQPSSLPPDAGGGGLGDILGGMLGGRAGSAGGAAGGGGLGGLLSGGLGGLLGGAAAGSVVSGGLGNLIKDLQANGLGHAAQSWVGTGTNQEVAPGDLESAVGTDTLDALTKQTGMSRDDLLAGLSQQLPGLVDKLTPHGRLPTEEEAGRMV
jgi:uncharacterized protein YidB (DUF937 family)